MKNWEVKKLGEVCKFIGGSQPPKSLFSYEDKEDYIRLIQIRDYKSNKNIVYIPKEKAKRFCDSKDIMIGRYGPPVFQILKGLDGAYNVALMKAVPNEKVLSKDYAFLFLKFSKIQDYIIHLSQRAAGQTGVNKEAIEDYPILVPPLSEQQRIVAILDEVFEAIAKAKANAEQNLKNAKELFESYLQEVLEKGNWEEKTLGQLSKKKDAVVSGPFGSNLKVSDYKTEGIPILRLQNIGKGYFINKSIKFITKEKAEELKYHSFVAGDIALAKLGIPIGKTCIIPDNFEAGIITADIVRIRPDLNVVNYKFLENFLNTSLSVSQLTGNISGATRPRVNLSDVRNIVIKLPSLNEQQAIVEKLDALSAETKRLEGIYQQKINDLEELKKSVLQKAFAGQLKTKESIAV